MSQPYIFISYLFLSGGGGGGGDGPFKNTTLIYSFRTFEKNICILVPIHYYLLTS